MAYFVSPLHVSPIGGARIGDAEGEHEQSVPPRSYRRIELDALAGTDSWLAWAVEREDFEPAFAFDAVGGEIGVVDGQNGGDGLAFREVHESGIGEVHRAIPVLRHQGTDLRQLV